MPFKKSDCTPEQLFAFGRTTKGKERERRPRWGRWEEELEGHDKRKEVRVFAGEDHPFSEDTVPIAQDPGKMVKEMLTGFEDIADRAIVRKICSRTHQEVRRPSEPHVFFHLPSTGAFQREW